MILDYCINYKLTVLLFWLSLMIVTIIGILIGYKLASSKDKGNNIQQKTNREEQGLYESDSPLGGEELSEVGCDSDLPTSSADSYLQSKDKESK